MKSAFEIVPYLLRRSERNLIGAITPLKLQKLLYYAQAWNLVFNRKVLFYEDIEAWIHGPVIPSVYRCYRKYGYNIIPEETLNSKLKVDEIDVLDLVLTSYGKKSAKFLEDLSHSEYPWLKARKGCLENQPSKKKISIRDMRNYYIQFIESRKPLTINPVAFKKKEHSKKSSGSKILSGIGSVLDIVPRASRHLSYDPEDFSTALSDLESISSDWEKIGSDLQRAFDLVEKESSPEHE